MLGDFGSSIEVGTRSSLVLIGESVGCVAVLSGDGDGVFCTLENGDDEDPADPERCLRVTGATPLGEGEPNMDESPDKERIL